MIDRGSGKRRASHSLPGDPKAKRRRGLWLMIGFSLVIFIVIVLFETQRELARQQEIATPGTTAADTAGAANEATAATGEPVTLLGRLKEHYRAYDLPMGWRVAGIDAPTEMAATVRIVFSPSPQDRRYGQSAPAEDTATDVYCPSGPQFWAGLEDRLVEVELSDKNGAVKTLYCVVTIQ